MGTFEIRPSKLSGVVSIPSSKSQSLRAVLFASLADGTSHIDGLLESPDTEAMIEAMNHLRAGAPIDCGNSGLVLRLVGALAALKPCETTITGDASIRERRTVAPLLDGLIQLGARVSSEEGRPPLVIGGPLTGGRAVIDGRDSQPVSGLLIAAAFAPRPIELHVNHPGEVPWVDLTLSWFDRLSIPYAREGYSFYALDGNAQIAPFTYRVPGDFSTAAFPMAAALVTGSELRLTNLDASDCQGDKAVIGVFEEMGGHFEWEGEDLVVRGGELKGVEVDVNRFIDALPVLAAVACFAHGKTRLFNGSIARQKESDRIASIAKELTKMGARIVECEDGLEIEGTPLHGASLRAHSDHRIALALAVAALGAAGASTISGVECVAKTYRTFAQDFKKIGANIDALE